MIKRFMKRENSDPGSSGSLQDLSFLLIIFFIVIAGFNVNKGFLLNLPSKEKPKIVHVDDLMKCNLKADGSLVIDGKNIDLKELSSIIEAKRTKWPNMTFLLQIEPETNYQVVIDVIYEIRNLNVENFSFRMIE